jgi:hypothetical protein
MFACNEALTAIATQHKLTYGLNLSPIRAARQNVPNGLNSRISTPSVCKALICYLTQPCSDLAMLEILRGGMCRNR